MNKNMMYAFIICQLLVQTALYVTICRPILKASVRHVEQLLKDVGIDMYWLYKIFNVAMIVCNLAISYVVLKFTDSGATAGLTNLTASVILGLFMILDVKLITRRKNYVKREN